MSVAGPVGVVLAKLISAKRVGTGWQARCPAHDDRVASLAINEGEDGRALLHCHAGCDTAAVIAALGMTPTELFADAPVAPVSKKRIVAVYQYRDERGHLLFENVRFEPKDFRSRVDVTHWGIKGVRRVLYRLNELQGHQIVYIVEGEKDVDRLWSLDIPATTNVGGAGKGKWHPEYGETLKKLGVEAVVIVPDNDDAGREHAEAIAANCFESGMAVKVVALPDIPPKGDISDYLLTHTKEELKQLAPKVLRWVPPPPIDIPSGPARWTEPALAGRFAIAAGDKFRYDHKRESWLHYETPCWRIDADKAVYRSALDFVRGEQIMVSRIADTKTREHELRAALKAETKQVLDRTVTVSTWTPPFNDDGEKWDRYPMLLAAANGIVNLNDGTLRDGVPEDRLTQRTDIPYRPDDKCPRWEQFLDEVFDGDADVVNYVHRALGYCLTGDMREQCFFTCIGEGSNGKSVFLDTVETVWGEYGLRANMRVFLSTGSDEDKFNLADFHGRRLIFAAETKVGARINEHMLKNFTGGESIRVERKYGHPFTIQPVGKVWLGVNHLPKVVDESYGFWRRVRIVPFLRTFTGSGEDRDLKGKLRAEAAGILAWGVRGALAWQRDGLQEPSSIRSATESYKENEDPLGIFLAEGVQPNPDGRVAASAFYKAYRDWGKAAGLPDRELISSTAFGRLVAKKFGHTQTSTGRKYLGISLNVKDLYSDHD